MKTASTLEFALVGLLRQKAQSGYDLRKTFTETAMRHYSDSPGSIYPALKRLRTRGWIEAEPKDSRGREGFHLTSEGIAALMAWLSQDVSREDVVFRVAELMLRFAFMDGNVPRSTTICFLKQFQQEFGIYVGELRAKFERDSFQKPVHTGLLAFEHGVQGMEAQLSWAREARRRLEEDVR